MNKENIEKDRRKKKGSELDLMKDSNNKALYMLGDKGESSGSSDDNCRIPSDCTYTFLSVWFFILFAFVVV